MIEKYSLIISCILIGSTIANAQNSKPVQQSDLCAEVKNYDSDKFMMVAGNRLIAKPEFNYYWGFSSDDQKYMDELKNMLIKYKINILTIPIPYQAALYITPSNNPAPNKYDPKQATAAYQSQIKNLISHGFYALDVDSIARNFPQTSDFFAKRDHHWTGEAMEVVASKAKDIVDSLNLDIDRKATTILSRKIEKYDGSISEELNSICGHKFFDPENRTFYDLSISTNESLLGDSNEDVVMVGDSFSIPYFGFDKIMSNTLKTPIVNKSINGGGCCASINGYFTSLHPSQPKPKLIIWTSLMVLTNSNEIRELKPSIYQAYQNSEPKYIKQLFLPSSTGGTVKFQTKLNKLDRYYIKISTSGNKVEDINFQFDYGTSKENISIWRKNEQQNTSYDTDFYYELAPGSTSLESMNISIHNPASLRIGLYKY